MKEKDIKKVSFFVLVGIYVFLTIIVFVCPRTEVSNFEGRKTASFPLLNIIDLSSGKWMSDFSNWFNDTVPFRDQILSLYTNVKKYRGFETEVRFVKNKNLENFNEESILKEEEKNERDKIEEVKISEQKIEDTKENIKEVEKEEIEKAILKKEAEENFTPDIEGADLNKTSGGAIFYGKGDNVRAMYSVSKFKESDKTYAEIVNKYQEIFPNTQVYVMMAPMQVAYYCPSQYQKYADNAKGIQDGMEPYFDDKIKLIDTYGALKKHRTEEIFLRTDHHWSPLGAYYASEEFAKVAGVEFKDLSHYEKVEIPGFVGTLYKFTQEQVLKDHPETFVIYKPKDIEYETYQMYYKTDAQGNMTRTSFVKEEDFFHNALIKKDTAYLTYMGGDTNTTYIKTKNNTGRNLLVFKDSFGNVVPPNLFYSFDEITVIDYRYFMDDLEKFVETSKITDILFVNCIDSCRDDKAAARYRHLLNLGNNGDE